MAALDVAADVLGAVVAVVDMAAELVTGLVVGALAVPRPAFLGWWLVAAFGAVVLTETPTFPRR